MGCDGAEAWRTCYGVPHERRQISRAVREQPTSWRRHTAVQKWRQIRGRVPEWAAAWLRHALGEQGWEASHAVPRWFWLWQAPGTGYFCIPGRWKVRGRMDGGQ